MLVTEFKRAVLLPESKLSQLATRRKGDCLQYEAEVRV